LIHFYKRLYIEHVPETVMPQTWLDILID